MLRKSYISVTILPLHRDFYGFAAKMLCVTIPIELLLTGFLLFCQAKSYSDTPPPLLEGGGVVLTNSI